MEAQYDVKKYNDSGNAPHKVCKGKNCTTDGMENNKGVGLCGIGTEQVFAEDFHFHAFSTHLMLEKFR